MTVVNQIKASDIPLQNLVADGKFLYTNPSNELKRDDIFHVNDLAFHTGIRKGLVKTINADPKLFDVSAGDGIIIDNTDPLNPIVTRISFPETLAITDPNLTAGTSHVYIDSAGVLTVETLPPTRSDVQNRLSLGTLVHDTVAQTIVVVVPDPVISYGSSATEIEDMVIGNGGITLRGGVITPASTDLSVNISAILVREFGRNFGINPGFPNVEDIPAKSPVLAANFFKVLNDGTNFVVDPVVKTDQLDPTVINLDGLGDLINISMNNFSKIRVFVSAIDNNVLFYYGTKEYSTLLDATTLPEPTFVEHPSTLGTSPIADIVIRNNVTDLADGIVVGTVAIHPVKSRVLS